MKNYYEILGVDKKATADEIKAAYRKLAKQYHPDLHPGDAAAAEKFKEINEANETLSDAQKRAAYDYELEHPGMGGFGGGGDRLRHPVRADQLCGDAARLRGAGAGPGGSLPLRRVAAGTGAGAAGGV